MAEVKWIKLSTDMFDNAKIKYLRTLPEGNNIILIWVMLLAKAGKCNSNGFILLTENIPYTKEMLAAEFGFDLNTIILALGALQRLNMIETKEEVVFISGWDEHQNIDGLDKIREQNRKRQIKFKNKQKELLGKSKEDNVSSNVTDNGEITQGNATDKDIDIDIDIDTTKVVSKEQLSKVIEKWNSLNLSKIVSIQSNRLKLLQARVKEYDLNNILKAIDSINSSSFLRGQNDRNWTITFDWFIKPNNFPKVLEGNYMDKDEKQSKPAYANEKPPLRFNNFEPRKYDYDKLEKKLLGWED